uniref:Uncharacterized protein n=1 Tax=Faecalibaculum rodentium TaxID=1702221 RepID=A0A140DRM5_9FIRM|nr:hypothetical protein AALO17_01680 [Faecalibaculum rodentium]
MRMSSLQGAGRKEGQAAIVSWVPPGNCQGAEGHSRHGIERNYSIEVTEMRRKNTYYQ